LSKPAHPVVARGAQRRHWHRHGGFFMGTAQFVL
jgi:hypothetical protein